MNLNALQILFLWIYHTSCVCITDVKNSCESFTELCHICEIFIRILHRCDKYVRIFHTCDRFVWLSHSNESVTRVKKSDVFVTHVQNKNEFFTGVTNTCEFFTRLKLDICEKLVRIKISKLAVRIFHRYQNVTYSCEYNFTACEKYEVWILRFNTAANLLY